MWGMGYFWKEKNCFCEEKNSFIKYKQYQNFFANFVKENTTLKLLIKVTRGTIFSIWTIKWKILYLIMQV